MKLRTGDIVLIDTEGLVPSTIDKVQGNDYNHAAFVVCIFGKEYVVEAIKTGVAFTLFSDYMSRSKKEDLNILILRSKVDYYKDISDADLINFILPLTQKPYGYKNLFIMQPIKFLFGKWIGGKETKGFICGQLVAYIENHFTGRFPNWVKVAPVDLYNSNEYFNVTDNN